MGKRGVLLLTVFLLLLLGYPLSAAAHASLEYAEPSPNAVLSEAPEAIQLTFNERLEKGLYYIRVFDSNGRSVTDESAVLSRDQRDLMLTLPHLKDGSYTVSYRVISADGHPVSAGFVFHVGAAERTVEPLYADEGAVHHHHAEDGNDWRSLLLYGIKSVYTALLLLLSGFLLWAVIKSDSIAGSRESLRAVDMMLRVFFLVLLGWMSMQLIPLLEEWSAREWTSLLNTSLGRLWVVQLAALMLGFVVVRRSRKMGAAIALLLLAVKASTGHAAAANTAWATLPLDFLHLLAAALWAGGLFLMLLHWREKRQETVQFLHVFAKFAWISMAVLVISGVLLTLLLLPNVQNFLYTAWGITLLVKIAAVLLVFPVAGWIHRKLKAEHNRVPGAVLMADFGLAILIAALAAVLSSLNPVPSNQSLHWHEMGDDIHMTAQISPNAPGHNQFAVKVWLPENEGAPKQVRMQLIPIHGKEEQAPIDIPLLPSLDPGERDFFLGFERYDYAAEGIYMAYPGRWKVSVRVTTGQDTEFVYSKELRIY